VLTHGLQGFEQTGALLDRARAGGVLVDADLYQLRPLPLAPSGQVVLLRLDAVGLFVGGYAHVAHYQQGAIAILHTPMLLLRGRLSIALGLLNTPSGLIPGFELSQVDQP
jgi:hypothetical protein